jgi:hypothetical protein
MTELNPTEFFYPSTIYFTNTDMNMKQQLSNTSNDFEPTNMAAIAVSPEGVAQVTTAMKSPNTGLSINEL